MENFFDPFVGNLGGLKLRIASLDLSNNMALAPMAGVTEWPMRLLCWEQGCAFAVTEMISAKGFLHAPRDRPAVQALLKKDPREGPVAIQLFGSEPDVCAEAARRLSDAGFCMIDLNMGCPARRVTSGGRGAALLCEPTRIARLVRTLTEALPVPVTGKIRLGWDASSRNYLEVARLLEDNGIAAIAVHGRTRAQQYSGVADWGAIAEVKAAVSVPVIGNGDVRSPADADRMQEMTGCDGVMVGRGAVGNPWIFDGRSIDTVSYPARLAVIRRHALWMSRLYGEPLGIVLFRKHVVRYVQGLHDATSVRPALLAAESSGELFGVLEAWSPDLSGQDLSPDQSEAEDSYED